MVAVDPLDAFLRLSLVRQRPATQQSTTRFPDWKFLFRGKAHGDFSAFLGAIYFAMELMDMAALPKVELRLWGYATCCARVTAACFPP
jgi:hypothetical protein